MNSKFFFNKIKEKKLSKTLNDFHSDLRELGISQNDFLEVFIVWSKFFLVIHGKHCASCWPSMFVDGEDSSIKIQLERDAQVEEVPLLLIM